MVTCDSCRIKQILEARVEFTDFLWLSHPFCVSAISGVKWDILCSYFRLLLPLSCFGELWGKMGLAWDEHNKTIEICD
jgi:hypothetical protein